MASPRDHTPIGSRRDRYLAILVGVVIGYLVGTYLEDRYAWKDVRMLTTPVGGLLVGVLARFALPQFRDPPERNNVRRLR